MYFKKRGEFVLFLVLAIVIIVGGFYFITYGLTGGLTGSAVVSENVQINETLESGIISNEDSSNLNEIAIPSSSNPPPLETSTNTLPSVNQDSQSPDSFGIYSDDNSDQLNVQAICGGGQPCSCGDTLTQSRSFVGGVDTFNNCGSDGLIIGSNGIVLNCNSVLIDGNGEVNNVGIKINEKKNLQIRNCGVTDFGHGVYSDGGENNSFENNTIYSNKKDGVRSIKDNSSEFIDNTIYTNSGRGISIINSTNIKINDSTIYSQLNPGIWFIGTDNSLIKSNLVHNNRYKNIELENSLNNTIENNIIDNVSSSLNNQGLSIIDSNFSIVRYNNLTNNSIFFMGSSSNNILINNYLYDVPYISINDQTPLNLLNKLIINNSYGFIEWELSNLSISNSFFPTNPFNLTQNHLYLTLSNDISHLNTHAKLELKNISNQSDFYILLKNGNRCDNTDNCNISYDHSQEILFANVSSLGSIGSNSNFIANGVPSAPTVNITYNPFNEPNPRSSFNLFCNVTINSTDVDNDPVNYTYYWYKNTILNLTYGPTAETFHKLGESNTTRSDVWNCTVVPSDQYSNGTNVTDGVNILNEISIVDPLIYSDEIGNSTIADLFGNWAFSDHDGDLEIYNETRWYNDSVEVLWSRNRTYFDSSGTKKGQNWIFSVRTYDGFDWTPWLNSSNLTILNSVPNLSALTFDQSPVYSNTNLDARVNYTDLDNDTSNLYFKWYVNNLNVHNYTAINFPNGSSVVSNFNSNNFSVGDYLNVSVYAYDGSSDSSTVWSSTVQVQDTPPEANNPILNSSDHPNNKTSGNLNSYWTFFDQDSDPLQSNWTEWFKDGLEVAELENLSIITSINTSKGEDWFFQIKVKAGGVWSGWFVSDNLTVINTPPNKPILNISNPVTTSSDIICNITINSTDIDYDAINYTFLWYLNGGISPFNITCEDSNGTSDCTFNDGPANVELDKYIDSDNNTGSHIQGPYYDIVMILGFESNINFSDLEISHKAGNSGNYIQNGTIEYWNGSSWLLYGIISNPNPDAVININGDSVNTNKLRINNTENSVVGAGWWPTEFKVNTLKPQLIRSVGPDSKIFDILNSGNTTKDDVWNCTVIPFDGEINGINSSIQITVQDTSPEANNLVLNSSDHPNNKTSGNLNSYWTFFDQDSDPLQSNWTEWFKDGLEVAGLENLSIIASSNTSKGEDWFFQTKVKAGGVWSGWSRSDNLTILNSVPSLSSLTFDQSPVYSNTNLDAQVNYTDLDNDTSNLYFKWYVNNVNVHNYTAVNFTNGSSVVSNLNSNNFSVGDYLNVSVYAYDGSSDSSTVWSSTVQVQDTPPEANNLVLNSSDHPNNKTSGNLNSYWTFFDQDGDSYQDNETKWYNNSIEVINLRNLTTVGSGNTTNGQNWTFSVKVKAGNIWSSWSNSNNLTILDSDSPPNTTFINFNATTINNYSSDTLTCWVIGEDNENSTLTAHWKVYNSSSLFNSSSTSIINGTKTNILNISSDYISEGDNWTCSVKMFDGYSNETDWNNATIIINTPGSGDTITDDLTLESDMVCEGTCLFIGSDNITLDLNGHSMTGNGSGSGIEIINVSGIVISNGSIDNLTNGLFVDPASGINISGLNITGSNVGINFLDINNSFIYDNNIFNNSLGINLSNSFNNLIYNNFFNNIKNAIDLDGNNSWNTTYDCSNQHWTNIIGKNCSGGNYWSNYNGLDDGKPVVEFNMSPWNISGDYIGDTLIPYKDGFNITNGGDYLPLVKVTAPVCGDTVTTDITLNADLLCSGDGLIIGKSGITIDLSSYKIQSNKSGIGINIINFSNIVVKSGKIRNFDNAVYVKDASNINISSLNITKSTIGLNVLNINNSWVENNWFINNDLGLNINLSDNNSIYNNYFKNNENVKDYNGLNYWNRTYNCSIPNWTNIVEENCSGGNFWFNYSGLDNGIPAHNFNMSPWNISGDGIGDTLIPYNESSNIVHGGDYLPLKPECTEDWSCTSWSSCNGGIQTRNCVDNNACGTEVFKPFTEKSCSSGGGGSGSSDTGDSESGSTSEDKKKPLKLKKLLKKIEKLPSKKPILGEIAKLDQIKEAIDDGKLKLEFKFRGDSTTESGTSSSSTQTSSVGSSSSGSSSKGNANKKTSISLVIENKFDYTLVAETAVEVKNEKEIFEDLSNDGIENTKRFKELLVKDLDLGSKSEKEINLELEKRSRMIEENTLLMSPLISNLFIESDSLTLTNELTGASIINTWNEVKDHKSMNGITYSNDLIFGDLLVNKLSGDKEIIANPGETLEINLEVQGISLNDQDVVVEMISDDELIIDTTVTIPSAELGTAIDLDSSLNKFDIYLVIPKEVEKLEEGSINNQYSLELSIYNVVEDVDLIMVPSKFSLINLIKLNSNSKNVLYTELFGPYDIDEGEGFIFAQQFNYDPEIYSEDKYSMSTIIYRNDEFISFNDYELDLELNTVNEIDDGYDLNEGLSSSIDQFTGASIIDSNYDVKTPISFIYLVIFLSMFVLMFIYSHQIKDDISKKIVKTSKKVRTREPDSVLIEKIKRSHKELKEHIENKKRRK